jgi:hypothetical protein
VVEDGLEQATCIQFAHSNDDALGLGWGWGCRKLWS